jgi:hypothetical protein
VRRQRLVFVETTLCLATVVVRSGTLNPALASAWRELPGEAPCDLAKTSVSMRIRSRLPDDTQTQRIPVSIERHPK